MRPVSAHPALVRTHRPPESRKDLAAQRETLKLLDAKIGSYERSLT